MALDDLADGAPEEWHFYVVFAADAGNPKPTKLCGPWATRFAKPWRPGMPTINSPALIEMDDTYFGAPKPGKRGRGAAGKAKVVVAVETPTAKKPRFAVMRMVTAGVSSAEIQPLVRERLATEAVIKTDGWQGYSFLDATRCAIMSRLVPRFGKGGPEGLALGPYLDRQY